MEVDRAASAASQGRKKRAFEEEKDEEETSAPGKKAKTGLEGKEKKYCKSCYESHFPADCWYKDVPKGGHCKNCFVNHQPKNCWHKSKNLAAPPTPATSTAFANARIVKAKEQTKRELAKRELEKEKEQTKRELQKQQYESKMQQQQLEFQMQMLRSFQQQAVQAPAVPTPAPQPVYNISNISGGYLALPGSTLNIGRGATLEAGNPQPLLEARAPQPLLEAGTPQNLESRQPLQLGRASNLSLPPPTSSGHEDDTQRSQREEDESKAVAEKERAEKEKAEKKARREAEKREKLAKSVLAYRSEQNTEGPGGRRPWEMLNRMPNRALNQLINLPSGRRLEA
jgi:hypothetical protein